MLKDEFQRRLMKRKRRVRAKVKGTDSQPRLSVFRSSRYLEVQLIDDQKGATLLSLHSKQLKKGTANKEIAKKLGNLLAEKALKIKIERVSFDRGGRKYHGQLQALAEGAREGGLKF